MKSVAFVFFALILPFALALFWHIFINENNSRASFIETFIYFEIMCAMFGTTLLHSCAN